MKMLILIFFEIHTDSILVYKFWQIKKQNLDFGKNLKFDFELDFGLPKWNGLKYDSNAIIFVLYKGSVSYSRGFFQNGTPKLKWSYCVLLVPTPHLVLLLK